MLAIQINQQRYALSAEQIQQIDYVQPLTPIPFIDKPIEGLTSFQGRPLLQLNLSTLRPVTAGCKRLIMDTPNGI
ncbi:MAG: hypothetical protein WAX77_07355, partial [Methylococcaceae bacterium]